MSPFTTPSHLGFGWPLYSFGRLFFNLHLFISEIKYPSKIFKKQMKFKEKEERKSKKQLFRVLSCFTCHHLKMPAFGLGCSTDRSGGAKAGAATGGEGAVGGAAGAAWWGARFDGEGAF